MNYKLIAAEFWSQFHFETVKIGAVVGMPQQFEILFVTTKTAQNKVKLLERIKNLVILGLA